MSVLVILMFSKFFYLASLTAYYTFFLMGRFHISLQNAQLHLFIFLGAVAAGTIIGGPVGDRFGRKFVIWWSILGVLPFALMLPYANLLWTSILSVIIGLILASAFSAILVYAQDLIPTKIGTVSGLFFGLAFGLGGIGAALLGKLADHTSINFVYHLCSFLPAVGILTGFLPTLSQARRSRTESGMYSTILPQHCAHYFLSAVPPTWYFDNQQRTVTSAVTLYIPVGCACHLSRIIIWS